MIRSATLRRAVLSGETRGRWFFFAAPPLLLWLGFARWIAPSAIEGIYRGELRLPFLDRLIAGAAHPLAYYLDAWARLSTTFFVAALGAGAAVFLLTRPFYFTRFVGAATAGQLGAVRIITCAILLASALWEDVASSALLPADMREPKGVMRLFHLLPGFGAFVSSPTALAAFQSFTALALALGLAGWRTRAVLPLGALGYLLLGGILRQYTWFYHVGVVPLYVLAVLAFTPCGDGLSLDRLRKIRRGETVAPAERAAPVYGWSRYLCWLVIALAYLAAGMSKIGNDGLFWLSADNLKRMMLRDSLNLMEFDWGASLYLVRAPDFLFSALAIATVAGELGFALVLFSAAARRIFPAAMALMHLGILFFQNVFFPDLIAIQLMFYDWSRAIEALRRWRCARAPAAVDGPARQPGRRSVAALLYPAGAGALIGTVLFCWLLRIEFYPFTAMQMYTKWGPIQPITYYKVLARYESGAASRAPLETIKALADSRYRAVIALAFSPARAELCKKYLAAVAAAYNARAAPGKKITGFEVQKWTWDFRSAPGDPAHGVLAGRVVFAPSTRRAS